MGMAFGTTRSEQRVRRTVRPYGWCKLRETACPTGKFFNLVSRMTAAGSRYPWRTAQLQTFIFYRRLMGLGDRRPTSAHAEPSPYDECLGLRTIMLYTLRSAMAMLMSY